MENSIELKEHMARAFLSKRLLYPNERVVAFLAQNYKDIERNASLKALDIGCGSGRHINLLLNYGINAFGVDHLEEGCKWSREILQDRNAAGDIYCGDFYNYYENETFDIIICFGVIFLMNIEKIQEWLIDIHRIMKNSARMIINFKTDEDCLYGKGKQLDEYSFLLDESAGPYSSLVCSFFSHDRAKELLMTAGFSIENVERYELWKDNLKNRHTWWHFSVKKQ